MFYLQKLKCVRRRDGNGWRLKACATTTKRHRHQQEEDACHCQPGAEFGWRLQLGMAASQLDASVRAERRMQRDFLMRHAKGIDMEEGGGAEKGLGKQHKFLKSLSTFR